MSRLALPTLLLALLTSACSGDLCSQAPRCDGSEALNCEPECTVGPCSSGPLLQECTSGTTCTVVPGDLTDARFYRSRAVCAVSLDACDPATAAASTCGEDRFVTGCGAHRRVIRVSCSQSGLYFAQAPACCQGAGPGDGGTDAGTGGDGGTDAGTADAGI
ncbi:hypothetical protein [Comamonas sp. JC664]|uniref:hypothetical protein n=1 Tax=Comamonas sp. JC664 TaxID=2801917 RepID=UPI00174E0AC1|nr:hypothetical protein [Comamonas sp. JC664]MBL0695816.1 hypothetical protein [Comamonas sp. JC664]GHG63648.1 hypothetical protein GCM10012319_03430 [Comamonas sp. KCTC 72670]